MDDLLGLGKGTDKLIAAVERALGAVYRPYGIRREANAEKYRFTTLEHAKTDVKCRNTVELARAKVKAEIILAEGKEALESRLQARLQYEALKQQQNIEQIVAGAIAQPQPDSTGEDVDEDWLAEFFERAKTVSGADMQALWSRVLALEVGTPGTFSKRALDTLRTMTHREAIAFQAACHLACSSAPNKARLTILYGATRDSWLWLSDTPEVELGEFGLPFLERINLAQIGLLYDENLVLGKIQRNEEFFIHFASSRLKLRAKRGNIRLQNYSLTPIGSELSALVANEENSEYVAHLHATLEKFFYVTKEST